MDVKPEMKKDKMVLKVAKLLTWNPGLEPRNSDSKFSKHSDCQSMMPFPWGVH